MRGNRNVETATNCKKSSFNKSDIRRWRKLGIGRHRIGFDSGGKLCYHEEISEEGIDCENE